MLSRQMIELQAQLSQQIKKTSQTEKEKTHATTLAGEEQVIHRAAEKAARAAEKNASAAEGPAEAALAKADTLRKAANAQRKAGSCVKRSETGVSFCGRHPSTATVSTPGAGGIAEPRGEENGP
jgi:hypothetical protein